MSIHIGRLRETMTPLTRSCQNARQRDAFSIKTNQSYQPIKFLPASNFNKRSMCKIVIHYLGLLNFSHIAQLFLFVSNPNVVALQQRGLWVEDFAHPKKCWLGAPYGLPHLSYTNCPRNSATDSKSFYLSHSTSYSHTYELHTVCNIRRNGRMHCDV